MAFVKKTWKNRIAEYINRRLLTKEDGSTELVTVARDEGQVSQEGDAFNAANMNDLEDRIEAGFTEINQSLTDKCPYYILKSSTDARDDYSIGFLLDEVALLGYVIINIKWTHIRFEIRSNNFRTYVKYGRNEWDQVI